MRTIERADQLSGVRHQLADDLRRAGWAGDRIDEAILLVSEILSNALLHTTSPAGLSVEISESTLRVEVSDHDSHSPVLQEFDPDRIGGHGLQLIEVLSQDWGVDLGTEGKTVWFTLGRDRL